MNWLKFVLPAAGCAAALTASPISVTVRVESGSPGPEIPADFSGLSFETQQVLPDAQGNYFFTAGNRQLITLFRTLGIKSLRVGGNTTDNPATAVPRPPDLDQLFGFAEAAGARVIFTLRLRQGDPSAAAATAKYIMDHYAGDMLCFAIGNEPNIYSKTYPEYLASLRKYLAAITGPGVAPSAVICGPSTTPSHAEWARRLAHDFSGDSRLRLISQHEYPGNSGSKVTDPAAARGAMLSAAWVAEYDSIHRSFVPAAAAGGFGYRLEETNSFYNGGAKDVSDTFAAALWALDYLHWWAAHDAAGMNFHTGDYVAKADETTRCWYASFWTRPSGGYDVRPVGFALKAFELSGPGRRIPVRLEGKIRPLNLTAYCVQSPAGSQTLTLINKGLGANGQSADVTVAAAPGAGIPQIVRLTVTGGDVASISGIQLGEGGFSADGRWQGRWTALAGSRAAPGFTVVVPAGSAALVRWSGK